LKRSKAKNLSKNWTIEDSSKTYEIKKWGGKYFSINIDGNISVSPNGEVKEGIDLFQLVNELKTREIHPPLILRFNDILKSRIVDLNQAFANAIKTYEYKNNYQGVFPIKCNHQRNILEKILEFGSPWHFGLEVGSKSELLIGLSMLKDENSLLICNGYKDKNYIDMTILARKLGRRPILVIEQRNEVKRLIQSVKELGAKPMIGIRTKLSSKGSGRWSKSIGDKSKFGLSIPEIMLTINDLKDANLIEELKLLHFHIGSQISDISIIKDALQEASQIFVEISKMGAPMKYLDVGGGLGIDYDGSKSASNNSTNYSLQNYANDVVATIKDSCSLNNVAQPIIISESGRSITSHCSVLIFNILGTNNINFEINQNDMPANSLIISNLLETLNQIKKINYDKDYSSKIIELWNDAKKFKNDSLATFRLGFMSLEERACAEQLTWACAKEISQRVNNEILNITELSDIKETLSSTYYGNFSVFKSTPDSWAISQVFPIIPIHRHKEYPAYSASFADLTCDSDGRLDRFINTGDLKSVINLHQFFDNEDYFIGIFLAGAYQEALGNMHNLFGNTNIIHIDIESDNTYKINKMIREDNKSEVLKMFDYNSKDLIESIRISCEQAIKNKQLKIYESRQLIAQVESSLRESTYFE
tara:strand:+ start:1184 stop:3127 length:1944 start_codon:yes stop_codon:yes gene_type:complete